MAKTKDFSGRFSSNAMSALGFMGISIQEDINKETENPIEENVDMVNEQSKVKEIDNVPNDVYTDTDSDASSDRKSMFSNSDADSDVTTNGTVAEPILQNSDTEKMSAELSAAQKVSNMYSSEGKGADIFDNSIDSSIPDQIQRDVVYQDSGRSRPRSGSVIGRGVKKVRVSLLFSEELTDALDDIAAQYNMSRNEIVNRILINYVKEHI